MIKWLFWFTCLPATFPTMLPGLCLFLDGVWLGLSHRCQSIATKAQSTTLKGSKEVVELSRPGNWKKASKTSWWGYVGLEQKLLVFGGSSKAFFNFRNIFSVAAFFLEPHPSEPTSKLQIKCPICWYHNIDQKRFQSAVNKMTHHLSGSEPKATPRHQLESNNVSQQLVSEKRANKNQRPWPFNDAFVLIRLSAFICQGGPTVLVAIFLKQPLHKLLDRFWKWRLQIDTHKLHTQTIYDLFYSKNASWMVSSLKPTTNNTNNTFFSSHPGALHWSWAPFNRWNLMTGGVEAKESRQTIWASSMWLLLESLDGEISKSSKTCTEWYIGKCPVETFKHV